MNEDAAYMLGSCIKDALISPSNNGEEPANVAEGLLAIAEAINRLAMVINKKDMKDIEITAIMTAE